MCRTCCGRCLPRPRQPAILPRLCFISSFTAGCSFLVIPKVLRACSRRCSRLSQSLLREFSEEDSFPGARVWRSPFSCAFLLRRFSTPSKCAAMLCLAFSRLRPCILRIEHIRQANPGMLPFLAGIGTLFLYTHYVATWLWLGLCMATLAACGWERLQGFPGNVPRRAGRAGAVAAGFGLAAFCPLFSPVLLKDMHGLWGLWGAGLLGAATLVFRPWAFAWGPRWPAGAAPWREPLPSRRSS